LLTGSQPTGKTRRHITQKPVEILRELVRICPPGGTILDPFAGAGSTGVAAVVEGRAFLGIEQTEHYRNVGWERLRQTAIAIDSGSASVGTLDSALLEETPTPVGGPHAKGQAAAKDGQHEGRDPHHRPQRLARVGNRGQ
jgi:hypothetical protein